MGEMNWCPNCKKMVGVASSFSWAIFLLLFFFTIVIGAIIYLVYHATRKKKCPICHNENLMPFEPELDNGVVDSKDPHTALFPNTEAAKRFDRIPFYILGGVGALIAIIALGIAAAPPDFEDLTPAQQEEVKATELTVQQKLTISQSAQTCALTAQYAGIDAYRVCMESLENDDLDYRLKNWRDAQKADGG